MQANSWEVFSTAVEQQPDETASKDAAPAEEVATSSTAEEVCSDALRTVITLCCNI